MQEESIITLGYTRVSGKKQVTEVSMRGGKKSCERALLYARSTGGDQQAIAAQLAKMRKHAAARSYILAGEVIDGPGSGNSLDRPGLVAVFKDALQVPSCFDVLLVTSITRLARKPNLVLAIISSLRARGIRIEVTDHADFGLPLLDQTPVTVANHLKRRRPRGDRHENQ